MAREFGGCVANNREHQQNILNDFQSQNPFEYDDDGIKKKRNKKRKKHDDEELEEHKHHHEHEEHGCCCNHEHKHEHHHHEEHECCCGHHHDHDHDDGCGCGCHHKTIKNEKINNIVLIIRFVLSVLLLIGAVFTNGIISIILLSLSYIIIAYDVIYSAIRNMLNKVFFDENFLMTLASLTALIVYFINPNAGIDGYDGVLVILLYQIGEFIQHKAVDKSKKSIRNMLSFDIDKVTRINGENQEVIDANNINIDDILLIKPGDTIPTDGIIIQGSSTLNTSSLTGESKPINVYENDRVLSGSINNEGLLHIKALTTYENSTSSKMKKMINDASKNKASSEKFITKFARIYTPIVILISLIVMFIVPLIIGFNEYFLTYLYKGLAIMVISCPCALVISIPLSYFSGIGKCAKNAILVKGSSYLELLANTNSIAFDKTGTLTKGNFKVSEISSNNEKLMNTLLYNFEKNLTHPIAISITNYLKDKVENIEVSEVINDPGYGMKGTYENKQVLIGNSKLFAKENIEIQTLDERLGTIIYVSYDNTYLGYVLIEDEIKEDAIIEINKLQEKYNVSLISGDNKAIVEKVANTLNINDRYYETLPEEKVNIISEKKKKGNIVYVGDGVNDAPCLLNATVGVSMKSLGSDIAVSASDIVLMDDSISSIRKVMNISRKTMKVVKQNIVFSIAIKVLVMILAMIVNVPMFIAIIADVGVCLLAILNSLRIMYGK